MNVHVSKNADELYLAIADWIVNAIEIGLQKTDRFALLLSGGNTPKKLYELLASDQFRNKIDWEKVDIFFGDERMVPFDDEKNNGRMANDALLSKVPIPKDQQFFIDTTKKPEIAAVEYEELLRGYFEDTKYTFDLALLGMGDDGHTLSIFPGFEKSLDEKRWVISVFATQQNMYRISLTPTIVNKSRLIAFLIEGKAKSAVLQKILGDENATVSFPAQLIKPQQGELHWFVDEAAVPSRQSQIPETSSETKINS